MLNETTIVNDTWVVKKKVEEGTFCELYVAQNIYDNSLVAIKAQREEIDGSVMQREWDVLLSLSDLEFTPKAIHYGCHNDTYYMVMSLLGESMSSLKKRLRLSTPLISIIPASYLAIQMLSCIEKLHKKGYVHRDIKPANFVRNSSDSTSFSMIDFGLAKLHLNPDGTTLPKREIVEFRGTTAYASPNMHELQEQGRRDDLWGLVFIFLDFICGMLPWLNAVRNNDRTEMKNSKLKYINDSSLLKNWIRESIESANKKIRQNENTAKFTYNLPNHASMEAFLQIIDYLKSLKYEDAPNYQFIADCLNIMAAQESANGSHPIHSLDYCCGGFQWLGGPNLTSLARYDTLDLDTNIRIINAKAKTLIKNFSTKYQLPNLNIDQINFDDNYSYNSTNSNNSNVDNSATDEPVPVSLADAKLWAELAQGLLLHVDSANDKTLIKEPRKRKRVYLQKYQFLALEDSNETLIVTSEAVDLLAVMLHHMKFFWGVRVPVVATVAKAVTLPPTTTTTTANGFHSGSIIGAKEEVEAEGTGIGALRSDGAEAEGEGRWEDFAAIQEVVYDFLILQDYTMEHPPDIVSFDYESERRRL